MEILFLISLAYGVVITVLLRRFYHIFFADCRVSNGTEWGIYGILFLLSLGTSACSSFYPYELNFYFL